MKKRKRRINFFKSYDFFHNNRLGRHVNTYLPFYDEHADYNTNAKTYYDYLARFNKAMQVFQRLINRLLNRNIEVKDTESIQFIKDGDWIDNGECPPMNYDDIIELYANVKMSLEKENRRLDYLGNYEIPNGSKIKHDGVWSPDYFSIINDIDIELKDINKRIDSIQGLNLERLVKDKDYEIQFYNGYYTETGDLIVSVSDMSNIIDIHIDTDSSAGLVLMNDTIGTTAEASLTPLTNYDPKCIIFTIKFLGDYAKYNTTPVAIDNTQASIWNIFPTNARAKWDALITIHNINNQFEFSWRSFADGYNASSLQQRYPDYENLELRYGNIKCKYTLVK